MEELIEKPWMPSEPLTAEGRVRVSWVTHSDAFRAGGRSAAHGRRGGACTQDAAHAILWHWCIGTIDIKGASDTDGMRERADAYPRWVPSSCPEGALDGSAEMAWRKCCGLRVRAAARR